MAFHPFNVLEKSQVTENQKLRDRRRRGIRSFNWYFNHTNEDRIHKIKCAERIIGDLKNSGPAGLIHLPILSTIIKKPIKIRNANGSLNRIIGRTRIGQPIDIEYHIINSGQIGHWTLRCGKDPDNASDSLNNCLFSTIGSQIRQDPSELRKRTILKLKNNLQELINRIDEILQLEGYDGVALMIGGARYCGESPSHAGRILDASQNQNCHAYRARGHPRNHVSSPSNTDSVEEYSRHGWKTGFLSRADQNYLTHLALSTSEAQVAMEKLNQGAKNMVISISVTKLVKSTNNVPKAKEYLEGEAITNAKDIKKVVLVLRHHEGQFENPHADVFVQTCYPVI